LKVIALVLGLMYVALCAITFSVMHRKPAEIARYMDKVPDLGWMLLPMETMWTWANRGELVPGSPAPDFDLATVDGTSHITLSSLKGKSVVLFFGSFTCPPFRRRMPDMNTLYESYKDRAQFYFIYVEEAHATDAWPVEKNTKDKILYANATTLDERAKAGQACSSGLKIPFPMLVDGMGNETEKAYRAWPIRVYVIDKNGAVAFKSKPGPFGFEAEAVKTALAAHLGPPAPVPAAEPAASPAPAARPAVS
jgi:peroxiredoxin